jgi:hypothetical protein
MRLAILNPGLDMASRLQLIQPAFSVFFEYMQKYPKCSWRSNISQSTIEKFKRERSGLSPCAAEHAILVSVYIGPLPSTEDSRTLSWRPVGSDLTQWSVILARPEVHSKGTCDGNNSSLRKLRL